MNNNNTKGTRHGTINNSWTKEQFRGKRLKQNFITKKQGTWTRTLDCGMGPWTMTNTVYACCWMDCFVLWPLPNLPTFTQTSNNVVVLTIKWRNFYYLLEGTCSSSKPPRLHLLRGNCSLPLLQKTLYTRYLNYYFSIKFESLTWTIFIG